MNKHGKKLLALVLTSQLVLGGMVTGGTLAKAEGEVIPDIHHGEASTSQENPTTAEMMVAPAPLSIKTTTLPEAEVGQPYSVTIDVYGGIAPYSFQVTGLPKGMHVSPDGIISGTPTSITSGAAVSVVVSDASVPIPLQAKQSYSLKTVYHRSDIADRIHIEKIGEYAVGMTNADGGVAEIVKYNKDNGKMYLVNGSATPPSLEIIKLGQGKGQSQLDKTILVKELSETDGFVFGDLTSVDIDHVKKRVYVAVQEKDPMKQGKILALDYEGNLTASCTAGVQPDMVKVTADGRYVLTADEAEPRLGSQDAPGSITIVDTDTGESTQLYFDHPQVIDDAVHIRDKRNLVNGVIAQAAGKEEAKYDLEPEYIALSEDHKTAYVALQENNAIATVDIASKKVLSVKSLGYKDFNTVVNALDLQKDGNILLENAPFQGVYMPDGIKAATMNGQTYLFTANEGDATEWPGMTNAVTVKDLKANLDPNSEAYSFLRGTTKYDKVEAAADFGKNGIYLFGGRSFSIWKADTMEQVFDSGSDFETITGQRLPDYFNASNSKIAKDDRSTKKGPEPEGIELGVVGSRTLAFVGLERVGGIMTYDVTNPETPAFVNYTNTRIFQDSNGKANLDTDTGPEGIEFIPAVNSPTGQPLLLAAFEVGGRVGVYQLNVTQVTLDHNTVSLTAGGSSTKLNAVVRPAGGSDTSVAWSSSDTSVATVDAQGTIQPRQVGTTVVTAVSSDGYGSAQSIVKVTANNIDNPGPSPKPNPPATPGPTTPTPKPVVTPAPTPEKQPEPTPQVPQPSVPLPSDVKGHWAASYIQTLLDKGIVVGRPDGSFKPNDKITRAEYMAVLFRSLNMEQIADAGSTFTDVSPEAWYGPYVGALTVSGIITGFPDGRLQPNQVMTREEACVILYRAWKNKLPSGAGAKQVDASQLSSWSRDAVIALVQAGIIQGGSNGDLKLKQTITRAEVAKMVAAVLS
ncbi:choice-of-anchor I family protein [Paenibacillus guangzhouensis]|uniref:choice-of-anchor I family protein n=1 Tax=Paenibacillus guangzhouensis TaxID=1473112 RepID=UPI00187BA727|nr:choice-of-anchor I family protein [Paenibacillus guangzhouensis]